MVLTLLLAVMMMLGLFLLLWSGVGFIQNKKFFTSCPKEVFNTLQPKEKRFYGQHALGYLLAVFSIVLMVSSLVIGAVNGIQRDFTFFQFFTRFVLILLLVKAFDIVFFDWVLLCNRGFRFFERYYPEIGDILSTKLFGYNKVEHLIHILCMVIGSIIGAWICTKF